MTRWPSWLLLGCRHLECAGVQVPREGLEARRERLRRTAEGEAGKKKKKKRVCELRLQSSDYPGVGSYFSSTA